jgi:hypothetical protein
VLLGDYIDRGRFSYNGVLRTVMQIFVAAPDHVYVLRGNHEYYIEYKGRIYGGVKPAEAINTLVGYMPGEMFEAYMQFFEQIPNVLLFDRTMFVHAGIPRDRDDGERFTDLSALNDPICGSRCCGAIRRAPTTSPTSCRPQNARFPFGRLQFEKLHEADRLHDAGARPREDRRGLPRGLPRQPDDLLNLFSAGGADNDDLPEQSSYRSVTPMACTIHVENGTARVVPWEIDYRRWNDPARNRFFATEPEIMHKIG